MKFFNIFMIMESTIPLFIIITFIFLSNDCFTFLKIIFFSFYKDKNPHYDNQTSQKSGKKIIFGKIVIILFFNFLISWCITWKRSSNASFSQTFFWKFLWLHFGSIYKRKNHNKKHYRQKACYIYPRIKKSLLSSLSNQNIPVKRFFVHPHFFNHPWCGFRSDSPAGKRNNRFFPLGADYACVSVDALDAFLFFGGDFDVFCLLFDEVNFFFFPGFKGWNHLGFADGADDFFGDAFHLAAGGPFLAVRTE